MMTWQHGIASILASLAFLSAGPAMAEGLAAENEIMGKDVFSLKVEKPANPALGANVAKTFFEDQDHVFLAGHSDKAWPDALAIGPVAGRTAKPVFITTAFGRLPGPDDAYIKEKVTGITILGGPAVVSPYTEQYLNLYGKEVTRIAGQNRFDTAAKIADQFWPQDAETVIIARGDDPADALGAQPLGAKLDAPILLTSPFQLPKETTTTLTRLTPKKVILVGGVQGISPVVAQTISQLLPRATVERVAGQTRFETAEAISKTYFAQSDTVFAGLNGDAPSKHNLATGKWADLFHLAAAAGKNEAPLLLRAREYDYLTFPLNQKVYAADFDSMPESLDNRKTPGWGNVEAAWRQAALIRANHGLTTKSSCTGHFHTKWIGWGGQTHKGDGSIWVGAWNAFWFLKSKDHMDVLVAPDTDYIRVIDETLRESHGDDYIQQKPDIAEFMERPGLAYRVGNCIHQTGGPDVPIGQRRLGPNELTP